MTLQQTSNRYICAEALILRISDETYWERLQGGEKSAYEYLFNLYYQALCRYAYTFLRDKDEAEESVQNLFFTIWSKRETIQVQQSVKSYLYRAVKNDALNRLKRQNVRNAYVQDYKYTAEVSGNGLEGMEVKELRAKIELAMERLPEQCGNVFKLSRFEHLSYNEIAQKLSISVKTVEAHMGKALRKMREELSEYLVMVIILLTSWGL